MISMHYACSVCKLHTDNLDVAQNHANELRHELRIHGSLTANRPPKQKELTEEEKAEQRALLATQRARENAILRAARDKGLVP